MIYTELKESLKKLAKDDTKRVVFMGTSDVFLNMNDVEKGNYLRGLKVIGDYALSILKPLICPDKPAFYRVGGSYQDYLAGKRQESEYKRKLEETDELLESKLGKLAYHNLQNAIVDYEWCRNKNNGFTTSWRAAARNSELAHKGINRLGAFVRVMYESLVIIGLHYFRKMSLKQRQALSLLEKLWEKKAKPVVIMLVFNKTDLIDADINTLLKARPNFSIGHEVGYIGEVDYSKGVLFEGKDNIDKMCYTIDYLWT